MDLQCLVIPRAGLVPADCKRLGEALHRWRSADPAARSLDQPGLDDLRDGELPPPRYVQHVRAAQGRANKALSYQEREDIRGGLGEALAVRGHQACAGDHQTLNADFRGAKIGDNLPLPKEVMDTQT